MMYDFRVWYSQLEDDRGAMASIMKDVEEQRNADSLSGYTHAPRYFDKM